MKKLIKNSSYLLVILLFTLFVSSYSDNTEADEPENCLEQYDVTEVVGYRLPKITDVTTLSPIVINRIRERTKSKSVIEEIQDDGNYRIRMRIHSRKNLGEDWMDALKEIYIDDSGFYRTSEKDYVDYRWGWNAPRENNHTGFIAHTSQSSTYHNNLKNKFRYRLNLLKFNENIGQTYVLLGWDVEYYNSTDFIATNSTATKKVHYSFTNLVMVEKTKVNEGIKTIRYKYTINDDGDNVPEVITVIQPVTVFGECMDKVTTKTYTNYEILNCNEEIEVAQLGENIKKMVKTKTNNDSYIYPNPADDMVNIVISDDFAPTKIRLYTMQGQPVSDIDVIEHENSYRFSSSHLSSGVYIVHISDNEQTKTLKLFIH